MPRPGGECGSSLVPFPPPHDVCVLSCDGCGVLYGANAASLRAYAARGYRWLCFECHKG